MNTAPAEPVAVTRSRHAKRAARAAGVGLAAAACSLLATWLLLDSSACRNAPEYGCFVYALAWSYALPFLVFLSTWPALRLVKVRPAWLTALLGTGIGWYLARNITTLQWLPGGTQYLQPALPVAVFALAAWFTQSRRPLWSRGAVALALVLLMPLDSFASTRHDHSRQDAELTAVRVPLLGPRVPTGYHLDGVGAQKSTADDDRTFYYRITPDDLSGEETMDDLKREIQVTVGPVQPGFTPPSHCAALTSVYPVPSPACTPVAPGVWRWSRYDYVEYFTRVGDTVAVLQARTPPVGEGLLRKLAGSMRVRPPSYFTGG